MKLTDIISLSLPEYESAEGMEDYAHAPSEVFADWVNKVMMFDWSHGWNEKLLLLLSIVGLLCLIYLIWMIPKSVSNIRNTSLLPVFLFTWIYGFLVYDIGMYTGDKISLLTNIPMSILYGFKIFLLDSDVSEIHASFHENWLFSGNFALVHFLAAFVTFLFVVKHFGYNLVSRLHIWLASHGRKTDEVYVFWGFNEASCLLIDSIKERLGKSGKNYKIIIVRTSKDDDDSPEGRTGLNRILDFLSMKNSELDKIQKLGCLSVCTYTNYSNLDIDLASDEEMDVLGKIFKLSTLQRLLKNRVNNKIHLLFLSNDEKENLFVVPLMTRDITLNEFAKSSPVQVTCSDDDKHCADSDVRLKLYCHARYDSVHRVIEDRNTNLHISVKVVDSSHISVEMLQNRDEVLPVQFVDVEEDATVSSPFNALVVGFSEVGQDCVRFLYEFGAFVKSGSTDKCVKRSLFHLDVVDRNMADLSGVFVANTPAIKTSLPFIEGGENPDALITLHRMDCLSAEFYLKLEQWIKRLNYVVIATDDDELNVSLGVRLFRLAARYRKNLKNFVILVRAHNDDGHITNIVQHYNRLWAAQMAIPGFEEDKYDGKAYKQSTVKRTDKFNAPLYLFGQDKKTYTYKNIIDDSVHKRAVEYKERYERSSNLEYDPAKNKYGTAMKQEFVERMRLDDDNSYSPSFAGLMGMRRTYGQDVANCQHALTKSLLAQIALEKAHIPQFDWKQLSRKYKEVTYCLNAGKAVDSMIIRILNVLAQTEHLRWNASHEILGYVQYGAPTYRNEVKMQHSCIIPWEKLDVVTKSYDYNVVDLTLGIIDPMRPIEVSNQK